MSLPFILGKYHLIEEIGSGHFGSFVYESHHTIKPHQRAYKLIPGHDRRSNFLDEVGELMRLNHTNIVRVFCGFIHHRDTPLPDGPDENNARAGLVMELGDEDLRDWFKRRNPADSETNIEMLYGICLGLQYLHSKNIEHGDIKPANIILKGDIPKLSDFGLSDSDGDMIIGRSRYAAPESRNFDDDEFIDYSKKSDIFSLGILLVQMFTPNKVFASWMYGRRYHQFPVMYNDYPFFRVPGLHYMSQYDQITAGCILRRDPIDRITMTNLLERIEYRLEDFE